MKRKRFASLFLVVLMLINSINFGTVLAENMSDDTVLSDVTNLEAATGENELLTEQMKESIQGETIVSDEPQGSPTAEFSEEQIATDDSLENIGESEAPVIEENNYKMRQMQNGKYMAYDIQTRDIEVYVTDGYSPIEGAEVTVADVTMTSDDEGNVFFENIPTSDITYDVKVNSADFGERVEYVVLPNTELLEDGISEINPTRLTVSYWSQENEVAQISEMFTLYSSVTNDWTYKENSQLTQGGSIWEYNGRIYIDGDQFMTYNPSNGSWAVLSGGGIGVGTMSSSVFCDNKIYTYYAWYRADGDDHWDGFHDLSVYDLETNTTEILEKDDYDAHFYEDAFSVNGELYFCGGERVAWDDWSESYTDIDVYSPYSNNWQNGVYPYTGRAYVCDKPGEYYNNIVLVSRDDTYIIDTETGEYDFYSPFPYSEITSPNLQEGDFWGNKLYLPCSNNDHNMLCIFDLDTKSWSSKAIPFQRENISVESFGGKVYVLGGTDYENEVYVYDIGSDSWEYMDTEVSILSDRTVEYQNKIYAVGSNGVLAIYDSTPNDGMLTVTVNDSERETFVSNATVKLTNASKTYSSTTNNNGVSELSGIKYGTYKLEISRAGFSTYSTNISINSSGTSRSVDMIAYKGNISVTVKDTDNQNLSKAQVTLESIDSWDNSSCEGVVGCTDSSGKITKSGVLYGQYKITVTKDGYASSSVNVNVNQNNATYSKTITLTQTGADVYAEVTKGVYDYYVLPGTQVRLISRNNEDEKYDLGTTASDGNTRVQNIPFGNYYLTATYPGYKDYSRSVTIDKNTSCLHIVMMPATGNIVVTVKDEYNKIVDNANLNIVTDTWGNPDYSFNGTNRVNDVFYGNYHITADKEGYTSGSSNVSITEDGKTYYVTVTLNREPGSILVTTGVAGAAVTWTGPMSVPNPAPTTDPSGNYTIECDTNWGTYDVTATKAGYTTDTKQVDINADNLEGKATLTINKQVNSFGVNVKDSKDNSAIDGASIVISGTSTTGETKEYTAQSGTDGVAAFTDVLYGTSYTITVSKTGYNSYTNTFTVPPSETPFQVELDRMPGNITVNSGVEGAKVTWIGPTTGSGEISNGEYIINCNDNWGTYNITVSAVGYNDASGSVTVSATNLTPPITLNPIPITGNVKVTVKDSITKVEIHGATIAMTGDTGSSYDSATQTYNNASYGSHTVTASKEGYVTGTATVNITEHGKLYEIVIELTPITGNVKVTVKDSVTKAEIHGATIAMTNETGSSYNIDTQTYSNASYGEHVITAAKDGYVTGTETVNITEHGKTYEIIIELTPITGTVKVTVIDATRGNAPISGATVTLADNISPQQTNENGIVTFTNVKYGTYTAFVTAANYESNSSAQIFVAENGQTYSDTVQLTPINGNITITVVDKNNNSLDGVSITETDQKLTAPENMGNGVYKYSNIAFDTYSFTISKGGYYSEQIDGVTISANVPDADKSTMLNAITPGSIEITVKSSIGDHDPVEGASAKLFSNGVQVGDTKNILSDGKVSFDVSAFGSYIVEISKQNYIEATKTYTIAAVPGQESVIDEILLTPFDKIVGFEEIKKEVENGTLAEDLPLPTEIKVYIDTNGDGIRDENADKTAHVTWDTSGYNPMEPGEYDIKGTINMAELPNISKPDDLNPAAEIIVDEIPPSPTPLPTASPTPSPTTEPLSIVSVETAYLEALENMPLGPTDRTHSIEGSPTTADVPETAKATLSDNSVIEIPVKWNISEYDPYDANENTPQVFGGEWILDEFTTADGRSICNPNGILPELKVTVIPTEYVLWGKDIAVDEAEVNEAGEVVIEVEYGTTIDQVNQILAKHEAHIWVITNDEYEYYLYSPYSISLNDTSYNANVPGEYHLTARLTENISNESDDSEHTVDVPVVVTVKESLKIVSVENSTLTAYQSMPLGPTDRTHKLSDTQLPNVIDTPDNVTVKLDNNTTAVADVLWDIENYNPYSVVEQQITGAIILPNGVTNPQNLEATLIITVEPIQYYLRAIDETKSINIEVEFGTTLDSINNLLSGDEVDIYAEEVNSGETYYIYSDYIVPQKDEDCNVDNSAYNPYAAGDYQLYGVLRKNIIPNAADTIIPVNVKVKEPLKIVSVDELTTLDAIENMPFRALDIGHSIGGMPNALESGSDDIPDNVPNVVTANLSDGSKIEVPVTWDISTYNPYNIEKNSSRTCELKGTLDLSEYGPDSSKYIQNPDDISAILKVKITSTEYVLWEKDIAVGGTEINEAGEVVIEVEYGTTIDQVNQILAKHEAHIWVVTNDEYGNEYYFYSPYSVKAESAIYDSHVPGEYHLTARLTENISNESDDSEYTVDVPIVVTVAEKREITSVISQSVNAYQGVAFENIENIPQTAEVELNNGETVSVNVEWNADTYQRELAGGQVVIGTLSDLPEYINTPDSSVKAALSINVTPVTYNIDSIAQVPNDIQISAGLTEEEFNALLAEELVTVNLVSVDEGVNIEIQEDLHFIIESSKNPNFDINVSEAYNLNVTLISPVPPQENGKLYINNINETDVPMTLVITKALITGIEEVGNVEVKMGTAFSDIEGLPESVLVNLSNGHTVMLEVDWGDGGDYNPNPEGISSDNPVSFTISGTFKNVPQYIWINENTPVPTIVINVIYYMEYYIQSITPSHIPESGVIEVNLGSSLDDIYAALDTRTVTLSLVDEDGVESTLENVGFTLREEDNPNYDSMTVGEYELNAYIELPDNIHNDNNCVVTVKIQTMKYTIYNTKTSKVEGVVSGTPFGEFDVPAKATAVYTTKKEEALPVIWDGSNYNPTKIGTQRLKGDFTPLPIYVENPNNRRPTLTVVVVNPEASILSLKQITDDEPMLFSMRSNNFDDFDDNLIEYKFEAEVQWADGSITTEIISMFEEADVE